MKNKFLLLLVTTAISACSLAPDFKTPKADVPTFFKETSSHKGTEVDDIVWKLAAPISGKDHSKWWEIFGDEQLNAFEQQAIDANQSLKSAAARVEQSREIANISKGGLFPDVTIGANAVRAKSSGSLTAPFGGASSPLKPYTVYGTEGVISYETDLFGRVRNNVKAAKLDSEEQATLYKSTLLALQADVATNYFALRSLDSERKLLHDTIKIRTEAERIMQKKFKEGAAGEQDAQRTKSELASAEADLILLDRQRAKIEHALAVLLGKAPSGFSFEESPLDDPATPEIPAGLPSELLERRPDIAAAVIAMQAANARIGVAKAAFFPSLTLTATGGFSSTAISNLFDKSAQSWALGQVAGNALSLPIFRGGINKANLKASQDAYDEVVANYRQQVLVAFRDVEDSLVDQKLLAEQSIKQNDAAQAATRTTSLAKKRYHEGETDYFEVVDSERISLALERSAVQTRGQRYITTISLIRALGGGWDDVAAK